jgi:hypothetical protein
MVEGLASGRDRHLFGPGPKRILSLDGGGVRGVASIAFLEKLETEVEAIEGQPTLLADWFDLIGGTSTSAIIASLLALGYRASEVREFYERLAPRIFKRSFRLLGWQSKFDARRLKDDLAEVIGKRPLDSPDLRTGLCVVLKRMDTGSAWVVMNNPRSGFWETHADRSFVGNRHLPIANLVRASAAAPGFFDPELIEIVAGQPPGLFVDGGLTPHNNPALLMLMVALLPAYGLNWHLGADNLLIVSVGTGSFRPTMDARSGVSALGLTARALIGMIAESQQLVLTPMTYFGQSPVEWPINSEIGDLGMVEAPTGNLYSVSCATTCDWNRPGLGTCSAKRSQPTRSHSSGRWISRRICPRSSISPGRRLACRSGRRILCRPDLHDPNQSGQFAGSGLGPSADHFAFSAWSLVVTAARASSKSRGTRCTVTKLGLSRAIACTAQAVRIVSSALNETSAGTFNVDHGGVSSVR